MPTLVVEAAAYLAPPTGIPRYTRAVVDRLPGLLPDWRFRFHIGPLLRQPPRLDGRGLPLDMRLPGMWPIARRWRHLFERNDQRPVEVYWEPNNAIPMATGAARVVLSLHDLSWVRQPEYHPEKRVQFMRRFVPWSVRRAAAIITATEFSRRELVRAFPILAERDLHVVPHGVDHERFRPLGEATLAATRARLDLPERFVCALGSREPRKNLGLLVTAWQALPATVRRDTRLVLAGPEGWCNQALDHRLAQDESIRVLGTIAEADLPALLNLATVFVFPSRYEGFGLPPVEAMACGCPTIVSRAGPLPEVVGEAAVVVSAREPGELVRALTSLLEDAERGRAWGERGRRHAARYTWEASARSHAAIFTGLEKPPCHRPGPP